MYQTLKEVLERLNALAVMYGLDSRVEVATKDSPSEKISKIWGDEDGESTKVTIYTENAP